MTTSGQAVKIVKGDWKGFSGTVLSISSGIASVKIQDPPAFFDGDVTVTVRVGSLVTR
jgi:transcription antitermination factor NusG